ncbi:MAG: extracellular solute-binding protein [Spirochaetales bacterium]|nr:extracellular solute-binding protein [Candidatus Physcosoma equi]
MKRTIVFALVLALVATMAFAQAASETSAAKERVVTTTCRASYATEEWYNKMNAAFEAETGIKVIVEPTPGNDDDHNTKVVSDLIAGSKIDVIETLGPRDQKSRVEAGFFAPLKAVSEKNGIDYNGIWGNNIVFEEDGDFYGYPYKNEMFVCYYNKDMFDAAGLAYPQAPWTWDDFMETAKKLSDVSNGKFGAYFSNHNPMEIMAAAQEEVSYYKADGTCNFDDPRFAAAVEAYKANGEAGSYPTVAYLMANNVSWNYWAIAGDHLGMFIEGDWFTRLLNSQADYPRNWKYGVVALPTTGTAEGAKNFVSTSFTSVNKNAAHPTEAAIYAAWLAQHQWEFEGGLPALASLDDAQQQKCLGAKASEFNGVTVADFYEAMFNNGLANTPSDIIGPACTEYDAIIKEEVEKYCLGQQDINATVSRVVSRVNEAIKSAQ